MESTTLWRRLQESGSPAEPGRTGLWGWLKQKLDIAHYRPMAADSVDSSQLTSRQGTYYILKNSAKRTYYRLGERDHFIWQLMDGTRSVKDLVVAYFFEYGSFAFARVAALVSGLKDAFLLSDRPTYVYRDTRKQLEGRRPSQRIDRLWKAFLQKEFAIEGLDRFVHSIYRRGGRFLFTWPAQVLFVGISLFGLYAFLRVLREGTYSIVAVEGNYWLGIVSLIAANLVSIMLHEMAHALAVKHYGREVRRGGFMLYFGTPAFFVDTTDIWMEGKKARLVVTWAGPYSGLILAGLASITMLRWPSAVLSSVLFKFALLTYVTVLFNLNPLLELDGYYMLMDWLEIPMLRRKSLAFIRTGLGEKIRNVIRNTTVPLRERFSFSREESLFTAFGLLSAAWSVYAIYAAAFFWQERFSSALRNLWTAGGDVTKILLAIAAVAISLPFVASIALFLLRLAMGVVGRISRWGLFDNTWIVFGLLVLLAVVLATVPRFVQVPVLSSVLAFVALACSFVLALLNARSYSGSMLCTVFCCFAGCSVSFLLMRGFADLTIAVPRLSGTFLPLAISFGHLAFAALLGAGVLLIANTDLRAVHSPERWLMGVVALVYYGLTLWFIVGRPLAGMAPLETSLAASGTLVPLLVLASIVPVLFSYWATDFGPAWFAFAGALVALQIGTFYGGSLLPGYLLLTTSLFLHRLAYRRISLVTDRPRAEAGMKDAFRLQRAFDWASSSLLTQFKQISGSRAVSSLVQRFNSHAQTSAWGVSLGPEGIRDWIPDQQSLLDRGETYATALTLLLDLMAAEIGERLTVLALQRAYDGLAWDEREIGDLYFFRNVRRAAALSDELRSAHQEYRGLIRHISLFATMDQGEIDLLVSRLRPERFRPGQVIIRQGRRGDKFYVIRRGQVEVTQRDERGVTEVVNKLRRGDFFGELALLRDAPRNATCRATVATEVLSLNRQDFDQLVKERFGLRDKLDRSVKWSGLLSRIPLFAELDGPSLQLIAAQLEERLYQPDQTVIEQGDIGDAFFLIESGKVRVSVEQEGKRKTVTDRGPGEFVGEIALLLNVPRTATVTAVEPTTMLVLSRADFDRHVAAQLYLSRSLERETSRRMIDLRNATLAV